jgi:ribulose-phosphate 3-epimerase
LIAPSVLSFDHSDLRTPVQELLQAGAQVIHLDVMDGQFVPPAHAHRLVQMLKSMGLEAGVAINPGTPVQAVEGVLDIADEILVMTVNPGWGGQEFIDSVMGKVAWIREMAPEILIEVDGGIDDDTLPVAKRHGADLFVVGSALTRSGSIGEVFRRLSALCG